MERDQLRTEEVVPGGNALGDGNVDLALVVDKAGYTPYTTGIETVFVNLEPCVFVEG